MKKSAILIALMIAHYIGFGQVDPEDIILEYNLMDGTTKIIYKSKLSSDLDSLSSYLLEEKRLELMTNKDTSEIKNLLIGTWILKGSNRSNGNSINLARSEKYIFREDGTFLSVEQSDSIPGKWSIKICSIGNLQLEYKEAQNPIKDKELLKILDEMQINTAFSSNILSINKIDEHQLTFITFIPITTSEDTDDSFYRTIFTRYEKVE